MSGNEQIVCFDSCIWIAWLKDGEGEKLAAEVLPAIGQMIDAMKSRELVIVTSTIAICEVLDCDLESGIREKIARWDREYLRVIEVNERIAKCTHTLRKYYHEHPDKKALSTPDAIHIATAVLERASTLYSFDKHDKDGYTGLLKLDGRIAEKWDLRIRVPGWDTEETPLEKYIRNEN